MLHTPQNEPAKEVCAILNSARDIFVLVDTTGVVFFLNDYGTLFQPFIHPPLRIHSSIFDSIPCAWQELARGILMNLLDSKQPAIVETRFSDAEGRMRFIELKCNAILSQHDTVTGILIVGRDVTPQKIFERKITAIAREQQSLIEHAHAVIIGTDSRGYITEWNEMASQVTGYKKSESYAKKLSQLLFEKGSSACHVCAMKDVLAGAVIPNYEVDIISRDKRKITLLVNATPKISPASDVIGILFIGQDITELTAYRKSLEQKVRERTEALQLAIQKEKEQVDVRNRFVSIASHEFRLPLSSIYRHIESIKTTLQNPPKETLDTLEKIQLQTTHMTALLEDVLTIGKSEAGKMKANIDVVELRHFLQDIIAEVLGYTHHTHGVQFDFPLPSLEIKSDAKLLRNIFINLLNNAITYSPGESHVYLSVTPGDSTVDITIKDKGIGIDEKDIGRIFEPFSRGTNTLEIKGTGLGLSIVKKAVEALDGKIFAKSKIREGALFTIRLNLDR